MEKPLAELQGEVKKDPELYKEVVHKLITEYSSLFALFPETPSSPNARLADLLTFLSQISPYFLSELKHFPSQLLNILNNYYSALDSDFRASVFQALILLRNREQIPAMSILPICFKLFRCQDKYLRLQAFNFLIKDIKKINKHSQNYQINKQLQGFIYEMIEDTNVTASKKSLHVLMTLYKKRIWTDPRTVNVIANACTLTESKLVMIGCTFLLLADTEEFASDSEGSDDEMPTTKIIGAKKNKGKVNQKDRAVAHYKKQLRRKERKTSDKEPSFLTIDQLNDPQTFVEKLLHNLQKVFTRGKHELQIVMLQVIARIAGRHKLMLSELYPFLQKFITPKSKKVTQILIICAEATHELVPPQEVQPVVKKILDNFLSEHCSEEYIVLGINCLREICKRQPLIMSKELLEHINTFKTFKNKAVVMATSGLVNLFKEIRPSLLRNKLREGEVDLVGEYGELKVHTRVPGAELLEIELPKKTWGNQQILISQPQQKSENLLRLEQLLLEKNAKKSEGTKKPKLTEESEEEDEGSDEEEEVSGEEEEVSGEEGEVSGEESEEDEDDENIDEEEENSEEEDEEEKSDDEDEEDVDSESDLDNPEVLRADVEDKLAEKTGSASGNGEEYEVYHSTLDMPFECDRIMTQNDFRRIRQLKREAEAKRRRIDIALVSDSDDDSNDFLEDQDLETMPVSKEEKVRQSIEEKSKEKRKRKEKKGGKTNREHAKNKPAMMVMKKKKDTMKKQFEAVKKKIRRSKQQLGKFNKRFSATKRQLK